MRRRYDLVRRIARLDPVADHLEIYQISAGQEFPWDYTRALEFALFRTYCVPSISALLAATGEFEKRPQQRYDDTALLMSEIATHGYDSPRGREALKARAAAVRLLPPRRTSVLGISRRNRTYPGYPTGYRPSDLGAPPPPADFPAEHLRRSG